MRWRAPVDAGELQARQNGRGMAQNSKQIADVSLNLFKNTIYDTALGKDRDFVNNRGKVLINGGPSVPRRWPQPQPQPQPQPPPHLPAEGGARAGGQPHHKLGVGCVAVGRPCVLQGASE